MNPEELLESVKKAWKLYTEATENNERLFRLEQYYKMQKRFLKFFGKIEIQNPEQVIGGRVTTSYRGRLNGFDVNDLATICLSPNQQTGLVQMPYTLDWYGVATRSVHSHTYKIKRVDDKVYWIPKFEDLIH